MCQANKSVRRVTLFEGQVKFIMERDTPEERLAAWETIAAIAFPIDNEHKYVPPSLPTDGSKLSPVDRVRRDVYNFLKDVIEKQAEKDIEKKDPKKVEAGRLGAVMRFGDRNGSSSDSSIGMDILRKEPKSENTRVAKESLVPIPSPVADPNSTNDVPMWGTRYKPNLTDAEKAEIAAWDKKIPSAKALQEYLQRNYMYQNKMTVITDEFCDFAYHKLAVIDRWISTRNRRPLHDIRQAIHYIALDYIKKAGEIRRAEQEEHRRDIEADFEMQTTQYSQQTPSELAAIERKRRRTAERQAMEKILKGEL